MKFTRVRSEKNEHGRIVHFDEILYNGESIFQQNKNLRGERQEGNDKFMSG